MLRPFRRIVVKIGSALLVDRETGLRTQWLEALADDFCSLLDAGAEVIAVSSGAISLGRIVLASRDGGCLPAGRLLRLEESQAAAAIGQIELSRAYSEVLSRRGRNSGQILLTLGDTQHRRRYLNARATISTLLNWKCVPVINENDSVATNEIRYGDNDRLAARVATMMGADLLVLLSDVDGLYSTPPPENASVEFLQSHFIGHVERIDDTIEAMAGESNSDHARGGMKTKIQAGKIATAAGTTMVITNGRQEHPLAALSSGGRATWFSPSIHPVSDRKKWIAGQLETQGRLYVDDGAVLALQNGKSLLSAGVTRVEGSFERGDTVSIFNGANTEIGRGLVAYDAADAAQIAGLKSSEIAKLLGVASRTELIHRDDLVLNLPYSGTQ
jgi:glutamate 5-kinase